MIRPHIKNECFPKGYFYEKLLMIIMGARNPFYIQYLQNELDLRIKRNSLYSLRSFARDLEVDASLLSKVLARKRVFSLKMADSIVQLLTNDSAIRETFLKSVSQESACFTLNKYNTDLSDCEDETKD